MLLCAVILSSCLLRSSGLIIEGQHWGLFWFLFESFLKPRNTKNHVGSLYNFSSIPTCKLKIKWFTQRGNRFHYLLIFHVKGLKEIICKHFACCTTEPELASIKRSFDIEYTYNLLKKKKEKGELSRQTGSSSVIWLSWIASCRTKKKRKSSPLSIATPRSSFTFLVCAWFLTSADDFFLLFSLCSLAWGTCADFLVSKDATEGPRNCVMSAGREKSLRKGMGWASATSLSNFRSFGYRADRPTRMPRKITLVEHKGR